MNKGRVNRETARVMANEDQGVAFTRAWNAYDPLIQALLNHHVMAIEHEETYPGSELCNQTEAALARVASDPHWAGVVAKAVEDLRAAEQQAALHAEKLRKRAEWLRGSSVEESGDASEATN
jgi:hypothetical protein